MSTLPQADRLSSTAVSDVLDVLGHPDHVMRPGTLAPLDRGTRAVGRAVTMRSEKMPESDQQPYKLGMELVEALEPGDVIVCNSPETACAAVWGELLTVRAMAKGARGFVTDGLVRDSLDHIEMGFPVFCAGTTPARSVGRCDIAAIHEPVTIGGVTVTTGDLIVADNDGCVVVPSEMVEEVVAAAIVKADNEAEMRGELDQGGSIDGVFAEFKSGFRNVGE
jgi:4-hydroxy-4-methyl-2-oxoglutarate aldolase